MYVNGHRRALPQSHFIIMLSNVNVADAISFQVLMTNTVYRPYWKIRKFKVQQHIQENNFILLLNLTGTAN